MKRNKKNGLTIDDQGNKFHTFNYDFHNVGAPAIEWVNGSKEWHQYGELHRTDGPAIEDVDGIKIWWYDGKMVTAHQVLMKAFKAGDMKAADNIINNYGEELKE